MSGKAKMTAEQVASRLDEVEVEYLASGGTVAELLAVLDDWIEEMSDAPGVIADDDDDDVDESDDDEFASGLDDTLEFESAIEEE